MEEENKVFGTGLYDEEQIEAFKQAFDLFDKDKGGSISNDELMAVMKSMGTPATKQEIDEMLAANDDDNDGEINFNEFINLMESRAKNPAKQDDTFGQAFKCFDRGHDGKVSVYELQSALANIKSDRTEEVVDVLKKFEDAEGNINYMEMIKKLLAEEE